MKGLPEDIEHFTARYEVLTKGCRGEMENIVSQLEKAQSSVSQMENHMKVIAKEYNLAKEDWQNVVYSEIELLEAKDKLKQLCQDREVKQQKYYQEDKNSVKVQQQMENTLQTLQRECNTREPLSRESIKSKEYAYERNLLLNRKEKAQQTYIIISKGWLFMKVVWMLWQITGQKMLFGIPWNGRILPVCLVRS